MGKLKSFQEQIQEAVENGINAVEEQHKQLAEKPFDIAEKIEEEAKSMSIKSVRGMHNDAMTSMYESIRTLNKRLGDYAGELLVKIEGVEEQKAKPVAKKAPAKKAPAKKAPAKKAPAKAAATA